MRFAALLVAAAVLVGCPLPAQAGGTHWFGYDVGAGIPTGRFGDAAEISRNVGLTYTYMFHPMLGLGAEIEYYRWRNSADMEDAYRSFYGDGVQYKQSDWQTTVHGGVALPIAGRIQPYVKGASGTTPPSTGWTCTATRPGWAISGSGICWVAGSACA